MVEQVCVFLRGVNVNGVKIKMTALKDAFAAMNYPAAKTILATGNVIISANGHNLTLLKSEIEEQLRVTFKYEATVFLRTAEELTSIRSAAQLMNTPQDCHLNYLLCDNAAVILELGVLFASLPHKTSEAFLPNDHGAFWVVPIGETLESAFGAKVLGDKRYKSLLTSRNMNTIEKIWAIMHV